MAAGILASSNQVTGSNGCGEEEGGNCLLSSLLPYALVFMGITLAVSCVYAVYRKIQIKKEMDKIIRRKLPLVREEVTRCTYTGVELSFLAKTRPFPNDQLNHVQP